MGLDSVELIMEIEKTFGIEIPSKITEQTNTVGQMYDVVWSLISHDKSEKCKSQILFYQLRRCLRSDFQVETMISPSSLTNEIVPQRHRRKVWKLLAERMSLKLPPLVFTRTAAVVLFIVSLLIVFFVVWLSSQYVDRSPIGPLTYLLGFAVAIFFIRLSSPSFDPIRITIPCQTMRDLTLRVLQLNYVYMSTDGGRRKEMEAIINHLIVERTGVDRKEISPEKSFVNDLGIN